MKSPAGRLNEQLTGWFSAPACHADAPSADETDWLQVQTLYDLLLGHDRPPMVGLNRSVALASVDGAEPAPAELDELAETLAGYHLLSIRLSGRGSTGQPADRTQGSRRMVRTGRRDNRPAP
ncbi:hypothetical protein [Microlunatus sp. Gsoil 973]|uniref:hypothetical protein n=1 Tax=Microlunatus sp. Gsoil 973 TaxID=2672569 RepID=UPI0018A87E96|nr:hypothetical protein [Microlunatus sp. Gsoil 973]